MRLMRVIGHAVAGVTGVLLLCGAAVPANSRSDVRPGEPMPAALDGRPAVTVFPLVRLPAPRPEAQPFGGYTPSQIRAAYSVKRLLRRGINGQGTTIVIVDSFGSPTIRNDLATFDAQF